MSKHIEQKNIKDAINEKIECGEVTMHSRLYFAARGLLLAFGVIFILLMVLYLVSFTAFSLRETGLLFAPSFGFFGALLLLKALPWTLILIGLLLIVLLEFLVRTYSFSYRQPILYTILGSLCIIAIGSILIDHTTFHRTLFEQARDDKLHVVGPLYKEFSLRRHSQMHPGTVTIFIEEGFMIENPRGEELLIATTTTTYFPCEHGLAIGDNVVVKGIQTGTTVVAEGVCKVMHEFRPPTRMHPPLHGGEFEIRIQQ